MNALESQLSYPFGDTVPELGTLFDVAPGIRWLRMRLPFALDHINLWLLRDEIRDEGGVRQGWTIVDCCIANDETRAAWSRLFAEALDGLPVLRVIVTHMHPDHMGLAHWLTERWNARLWISATDYNTARLATGSTFAFGGRKSADFLARHGLTDAAALVQIEGRGNYYISLVPQVPPGYRRLLDGDTLQIGSGTERADWTCHVGYGHAPEHMSFLRPGTGQAGTAAASDPGAVLISGDMVLPRISTNVSVIEVEPEANPLALYLQSLQRMRQLPADCLVLPSHGRPFRGLHTRIDQLVAHHDERFTEVLAACAEAPQSAADLLPVLFQRKLDLHQISFAMGESIAHLHALWLAGKLLRRVDDKGVYRFSNT